MREGIKGGWGKERQSYERIKGEREEGRDSKGRRERERGRLTSPGKQNTDSSSTSCLVKSMSLLNSGNSCILIPTIRYIAPDGIIGLRPGALDKPSYINSAFIWNEKTKYTKDHMLLLVVVVIHSFLISYSNAYNKYLPLLSREMSILKLSPLA